MRILLTGHRGRLGPAIHQRLIADGHTVHGFDLVDSQDVMDLAALRRAASGMHAIVHAAGVPDDRDAPPEAKLVVNLAGTANVLLAAESEAVGRVVYLSSGKALGMLERDPDYLPIDDDHRGLPTRPYGLAKWLAEQMCAAFTQRTGIATVCLRPVAVFDQAGYARAIAAPSSAPVPGTAWHLAVHIDVRDVADAVAAALQRPISGHERLLLCAADVADRRTTRELVDAFAPHVPWRGGPEYTQDPYRALVDTGRARRVLGWEPRFPWPGRYA
jgi:nucleoside-diphosphate-sugar epimerase